MKQLMACLALIGALVNAGIVYPQTMKVYSVDEDDEGNRTVTLCSSDGLFYGADTESSDFTVGELVAVLMYDNMTTRDISDDTVIAMRRTGFFDAGGGENEN